MKKNILFLFIFFLSLSVYSQKFFIKVGKNYMSYRFRNFPNISSSVSSDTGDSYEVGYSSDLAGYDERFSYEFGMSLNEFNAVVRAPEEAIKYNVQYLGVQNGLAFRILGDAHRERASLSAVAGLSVNKLIFGKEEIEGKIYNIKEYDEFNKLLFMASLGLNVGFTVSDAVNLNVGYVYNQSFLNTGNNSNTSLSISGNQFKIGMYFNLD